MSVFSSVDENGILTNTDNVADDATLELAGARDVATAVVSGVTYLYVAGDINDGISVFSVNPGGTLKNEQNLADDSIPPSSMG